MEAGLTTDGVRAFVFLGQGGVDTLTELRWPLPEDDRPGAWLEDERIAACSADDLVWRLDDELWEVELAEPMAISPRRLHANRGRLVRRIGAWTPAVARGLTDACAKRVRERTAAELTRSELDAFAADVVLYAGEARGDTDGAGVAAYIAAHALAGADKLAANYEQRFEEERRWQAEWLKEQLLL